MQLADIIWTIVGFILTVLVFSYLFGDNFLFRVVSYIFVGVTAGYLVSVIVYQVLWPRLVIPLLHGSTGEKLLTIAPLVLSVLLLTRLFPRLNVPSRIPMAYLVGVGAAVTIGGAVLGTLFGQVNGILALFDSQNMTSAAGESGTFSRILQGLYVLLGTVATLIYFQFGTGKAKSGQPSRRPVFLEFLSGLGQFFVAVTLGALLAGVFTASISALIDRVDFIQSIFKMLF